ncbi:MAG: GNAT family N-acetyltransferase [Proteobacteria bacterium]|nr:GNAT family N-acetyltransferase [Pseudomonadota bacterium]
MNAESFSPIHRLFARALELKLSPVEFLRLGLYQKGLYGHDVDQHLAAAAAASRSDEPVEAMELAGQRFSSLLVAQVQRLVNTDSAVLLVGHSLDKVAEEISAAAQISNASILDLKTESNFDVIVIEGSIVYLEQLAVLSKSRQLLNPNGKLLLIGEFLDDDSALAPSALANLSSLKQLSRRLGLELLEEADLTASAIESARQLSALLIARHHNLDGLPQGSDTDFDSCVQELLNAVDEFESHRRCFRLFQFSMMAAPEGEVVQAEYADIDSFDPLEIAELFQKSFGVDFDADIWHWKYMQGDGKCVVARPIRDGAIVAHYGGAPRHIYYFGAAALAIQICDVMVLPEIRGQYGKSSLFFKVAATFLEREIGNTVRHLLGFGFPNQKAMNIAIRLGLYEKTDDFVEVLYPRSDGPTQNSAHILTALDLTDRAQRLQLDSLWQAMRTDFEDNIIGVRDCAYICYRYFEHPSARDKRYRCVSILDSISHQPLAIAILKDSDGYTLIMDLICPLDAVSPAISALNQTLGESSQTQGLKMWITRGCLSRIMLDGAIVNELGIEIPCNSWNPGPSAASLYGRWWLTAGDMDFM